MPFHVVSVHVMSSNTVPCHVFCVGYVERCWPSLDAVCQSVDQTNMRERSTYHYLVVAAARAIRIEILRADPFCQEETSRRRVLGDLADRRDVIGCNRVPEVQQTICAFQLPQ